MSVSYQNLQKMTVEQLIAKHDEVAVSTSVGINYYLEELQRRQIENSNKVMVRCTIAITFMTAIMLLATVANVVIAVLR